MLSLKKKRCAGMFAQVSLDLTKRQKSVLFVPQTGLPEIPKEYFVIRINRGNQD